MARIDPVQIGTLWDDPPNPDPYHVTFESESHCCDGCEEHPDGHTGSSMMPVKMTVAVDPDLMEAEGLGVELRFDFFGKPQSMRLNAAAAEDLAKSLRWAIDGGLGWKPEPQHEDR